ncbi:hypothetical protein I79_016896 [Cricetulus griseus]|uniref:Uncharacterized protein n=1 Tax=Cricetulus griseus TaxID=10029 RepID=G3I0K8_CRIGR|nr:hypothetical protein I79_016896 [Cricetulus griseus]
MQHPRDVTDIAATSFSPSQPGCNTERGAIGRDRGKGSGERRQGVQAGLPVLPLDWHTSTRVMFSYIRNYAMKISAKCSSVTSSSWNFC